MLRVTTNIFINEREIQLTAVRSQGAGGQNVNKVSSAIHLRFDINRSSLPIAIKNKLLALQDSRITADGEIIIKAQESRSQFKNKKIALDRLLSLIRSAAIQPGRRIATKIKKSTRLKRQNAKRKHSMKKSLRRNLINYDNK